MFANRVLHAPACASCRLRGVIAAKQLARTKRTTASPTYRSKPLAAAEFSTASRRWRQQPRPLRDDETEEQGQEQEQRPEELEAEEEGIRYAQQLLSKGVERQSPEKAALTARETYGARLPEGALDGEAYRVYERLYGAPLGEGEVDGEEGGVQLVEAEESVRNVEKGGLGTGVLREIQGGGLEEVVFDEELGVEEEEGLETDEMEEEGEDDLRLRVDIDSALASQTETSALEAADTATHEEEPHERAHPLTPPNRFATDPTTLPLPTSSLTEPITALLAGTNNKHLADSAHRTLGGIGLPYGPSTPNRAKTMQAKPIQIDASQHNVSDIEGDVFLAAVLPGVYAGVMAVLTETRKRLGSAWAEDLVRKAEKGELRILDAGGAGAGVLAVREMLRAEWERMHEKRSTHDSPLALAEAGGRLGGAGVSPPLGNATVVTGSDVLRHRASKLLENTTFIPRLPDYVHTSQQKARGKFDLVIAPHTLWSGFRFDRERKSHVLNLWGLCEGEGGVLVLLEKGVGRGFEVVAGAREMLLQTRIRSAGSAGTEFDEDVYSGAEIEWEGASLEEAEGESKTKGEVKVPVWEKEKGTIIAPCTNHAACPMYRPKRFLKGRRDICAFEQRFVRPHFLQRILGAKDKNFEDVAFSYLAVMRGRDLLEEQSLAQGKESTDAAFAGYESTTSPSDVNGMTLPRAVLPPLKKKGHVHLDLCTPEGKLERWTVPRSFSKRAFRDARKARWGDLWALGAKTRLLRVPKVGMKHGGKLTKEQRAEVKGMEAEERRGVSSKGRGRGRAVVVEKDMGAEDVELPEEEERLDEEQEVHGERKSVLDTDEYGRLIVKDAGPKATGGRSGAAAAGRSRGEGGRMRTGQKVGGLRDKRDTSGRGNGRRKVRWEE